MAGTRLQFNQRKFRGLSGNQLKMIAFFLMLCDHIGLMLIENGVLYGNNVMYWNLAINSEAGRKWYIAARVLRFIGRLSFPIFAFFVAEGFLHTQNLTRYILRMGIFAAISEVPFDLACTGTAYNPEYQNVLFTYFIALIALKLLYKERKLSIVVRILTALLFCGIAYLVRSDYGPLGVALICLLYMLRNDPKMRLVAGAAVSAAESFWYYGVSALSFLLLRTYNGSRGHVPLKYFFYFMYPAHLLLFWAMVYFANR